MSRPDPLFDLAAGLARAHAAGLRQGPEGPCVRVVRLDGTEFTGSGYTIDEFEAGRLTVSPVTDDPAFSALVRVFEPGTWAEAIVYNPETGYPLFSFSANVSNKTDREVA